MIHPEQINSLNHNHDINGPVVYWMSRDQRTNHNWALLFAEQLALENHQTLIVVFNLVLSCPDATLRHYDFMLKGLMQTEQKLEALNIPFFILAGEPEAEVHRFIATYKVGAVVSDFSPLKISGTWKKKTLESAPAPCYEVDAHNIVPCRAASNKMEFSARTIRPKINRKLDTFLTAFPELKRQSSQKRIVSRPVDWEIS